MSFTLGIIAPHSPLLIDTIGKENTAEFSKTIQAFKNIEQDIYAMQIKNFIIISPHGKQARDSFTVLLNETYKTDYSEFGDYSEPKTIASNIGMIQKIHESIINAFPLSIVSAETIDYGFTVPLNYLMANNKNVKILPINTSSLDVQTHFNFGEKLKNFIMESNEKIAIIASADLSHKLTKQSPGGYSPLAKKFDKKVIDIIKKQNYQELLNFESNYLSEIGECGIKCIAILLGILNDVAHQTEVLSYECPFGIGHMVATLK